MQPDYMHTVNSAETAAAFLASLHLCGLLFHPEENPFDCLQGHALGSPVLGRINDNMAACFAYLPDPCETALALLNA